VDELPSCWTLIPWQSNSLSWNLQLRINWAFKWSKASSTYLVANAEKSDIPAVYTRQGGDYDNYHYGWKLKRRAS